MSLMLDLSNILGLSIDVAESDEPVYLIYVKRNGNTLNFSLSETYAGYQNHKASEIYAILNSGIPIKFWGVDGPAQTRGYLFVNTSVYWATTDIRQSINPSTIIYPVNPILV